jgi:hypothetical protein
MQNIYGVLINGVHTDVSKTERGAKAYATRHGYLTVTIRYICGYDVQQIAHKYTGKWKGIIPPPPTEINQVY